MCSKKLDDGKDFYTFGRNIVNDCYIDLSQFLEKEMFLYELYLTTDEKSKPIGVPVLVANIWNGYAKRNQDKNNFQMNNEAPKDHWNLTRRFFLFDNKYGNQNDGFITYAQSIKLVVEKRKKEGKIYIPYLEIFYSRRLLSNLVLHPDAYVTFISEYTEDISRFMKTMLILLIICIIVVFAIVIYRMIVWVKINPSELSPSNFFLQLILTFIFKLFKFWGIFMFWFTFIISAYWYFFYKLQYKVYLLLPPNNDENYNKYYKKFDIVFGVGCAVYILYMFYRIAMQVSFDIFFIDWEHDKEIFTNLRGDNLDVVTQYIKYRGAWRLLHVANQFNALQKKRVVNLYFCFTWYILLYYRCSWCDRELHVPRLDKVEKAEVNYVLRHFLVSIIILSVGVIQLILTRLLQIWLPLKKQEFLDLCSVANISVFILDETLHGYYIHGRSPFGKADSNLDQLLRYLEEEKKGKIRERGFGQKDSQAYDMYISYRMRTTYDGLFCIQNEVMQARFSKDPIKSLGKSKISNIFKYIRDGKDLNLLGNYMNNQLKVKIENVNSQQRELKEKPFIQRLLDYPPANVGGIQDARDIELFNDQNYYFDEVLFSGMEWEWFVMDVYLLQMWMRVLNNAEIGLFLCFLCDQILFFIRVYLGEKNVSKKAVIDNRFFS